MKRYRQVLVLLWGTAAVCQAASAFELNLPPEKQASFERAGAGQTNASSVAPSAPRSFDTTWDRNSDFDPGIGRSAASNLEAMVSNSGDLTEGRGSRLTEAEHASNAVAQYKSKSTSNNAEKPAGH